MSYHFHSSLYRVTKAVRIQLPHFWVSKKRLSYFLAAFPENHWFLSMGMYYEGGGSHSTQGPPSYRVWGGGEGASTHPCPTYNQMHAGFSFSYPPISVLLRQSLSIKKSYVGAVQQFFFYGITKETVEMLYEKRSSMYRKFLFWCAFSVVALSAGFFMFFKLKKGVGSSVRRIVFCFGQCCGSESGSGGSICFWASWIQIRIH